MTTLLSILKVFLAAMVTCLVAYPIYVLAQKLIISPDSKYLESLVGAFLGAFFAFMFVRFGEVVAQAYARKAKHWSGLVQLEHNLNEIMNLSQENLHTIQEMERRCDAFALAPGLKPLFELSFTAFPVDREVLHSLTNLELINALFSLNIDLRRTNDSMETLRQGFSALNSSYFDGRADVDAYRRGLSGVHKELPKFAGFLNEIHDNAMTLIAEIRILQRSKPWFMRLTMIALQSRFTKKQLASVEHEKMAIKAEMEAVNQAHLQRIKRI